MLFFKQKTAYELRISDWSSDVCSSDLFRNSRVWRVRIRPADGAFQLLCDGENRRFTTAAPDQLDAQGESAFGEPGGHSGRRVAADIPDRTVGGDRQRLADC